MHYAVLSEGERCDAGRDDDDNNEDDNGNIYTVVSIILIL